MSKVKLLYVLYDRPSHPSGPIVNLRRILPLLVERGYEVNLISFSQTKESPNANFLATKGVNTFVFLAKKPTIEMVNDIFDVAEKVQPDIFVPDVSTPGCLAAKWLRECNIQTVNSHRSDDAFNWGKAIYFSDKKYDFCTSAIFCVSNYLEQELKNRVSELGVITTVIPSGVTVPEFKSDHSENFLKVVYAGRIVEKQKRIVETVQLAIKACEQIENLSFTFIGNGESLSQCEKMVADSPFSDKISFTGVLFGDEYKKKLAEHQAMILLSDYEGVPGSIMDGMSCGLVPIVNDYPGARDLVSDNEGFVIHRDAKELIDCLKLLSQNKELRTDLGVQSRQKIIAKFSDKYAVDQWETLIKDLLRKDEKRNFVKPKRVKLPKHSALLQEYGLDKQYTWFYKLRTQMRVRSRMLKLLGR